jgi:hypothetical protein
MAGKEFSPGGEKREKPQRASIFPIDADVTRKAIWEYTPLNPSLEDRAARGEKIINRILQQSPALFHEMFGELVIMSSDEVQENYFNGTLVGYGSIEEQAQRNGANMPTISPEILAADMQNTKDQVKKSDDILPYFMRKIEEIKDADPGFIEPLREYAPDPEIDSNQFIFLASAVDTYNRLKMAEQADAMMREFWMPDFGEEDQ